MTRLLLCSALSTALCLCAGPVAAQAGFTDVTAARGITIVNQYGPVLPNDTDMLPTESQQIDIVQRNQGNGAAVGDYDNDGDLDVLILSQKNFRMALYRNNHPTPSFTDVTVQAGLFNRGQSRVANFIDLDNDGWKDLVVLNDMRCDAPNCPQAAPVEPVVLRSVGAQPLPSEQGPFYGQQHAPSSIYRNNGDGSFSDMTPDSGFDPTGYVIGGLGFVDFDRDGRMDIYVTTWGGLQAAGFTYMEGYNRLYWNQGNFKFKDATRSLGLGTLRSNSYAPIFSDFDLDGDTDLFVAIDGYADKFYRWEAGKFADQTTMVGATHVGTDMGVAHGDFDDDGDMDMFVTNVTDPAGAWGGNTLYVNKLVENGTLSFVNEANARGVKNSGWGWGAEWVDVDNDGDLDLFAVNGFDEWVVALAQPAGLLNRPADLFLNDGTGNFTKAVNSGAEVVGDARSAIAFDVDRDGDQDLLITHVDGPHALLLNDLNDGGGTNHWLDVSLVGNGTVNSEGIGARIRAIVGPKTYTRELIAGGSFLSGRPFEVHFGLGAATQVDQLWVHWPDGTTTMLSNVAADQHVFVQH